jgi:hypothetical protein
MEYNPNIIRPFGILGARYKVGRRGILLYRLILTANVILIIYESIVLWAIPTPFNPAFYFGFMIYLIVREILVARILVSANRIEAGKLAEGAN